MSLLTGPRMYYSLLGPSGVLLGAKARLLGRSIQVVVEIAGVRHPVHLRLRTTDVWLCQQILVDTQYDCNLTIPPRAIVDAGANIGLASIFYANKYPEAKIIAVEPEPSNFEMLRKNVSLYPNVVPIQAALWNKKKELHCSAIASGDHAYQVGEKHASYHDAGCNTVSGFSVRDLMTDFGIQRIDLLKVDIEGSEKEVFQDSESWIGHVGVIAIEIHDWIRSGSGESVISATADFELKWRHGETNYFARIGEAPSAQLLSQPRLDSRDLVSRHTPSKFPLKIVQVV
jgi:FkbM family methyltransferase